MVFSINGAATAVAVASQSNPAAQSPAATPTPPKKYPYTTRQDVLAQEVWPFRTEVRERYSQLVAWNDDHLFIKNPDGAVRRFPSNAEAGMKITGLPLEIRYLPEMARVHRMALWEEDSQSILDFSGPDRQATVVAGYELDFEGSVIRYKVGAEPIVSLVGDRAIYALGRGPSGESQYMVCQGQAEKCSGGFACRDMLLSEGKGVAEVIALLGPHRMTRDARGITRDELVDEICDSWKKDRPLVLRLDKKPYEEGLQALKEKLDKHGSCMLGCDFNAWIMLDSLEQVGPGHWTHRTRSPFHGSVVESHTVLGAADGQAGQQGSLATFHDNDIDRVPLHLDLSDAFVAIFRSEPLSTKDTQPPEDVVRIPV